MHAISFQTKRAHLSAIAMGRKIFRGTKPIEDPDWDGIPDMTPARFDILYLVLGKRIGRACPPPRMMEMAAIVRKLGLARATISKAVKRLVQLGLVTCSLMYGSGRNKVVALTDEGTARIKRALDVVFNKRPLDQHYRRLAIQYARRVRLRKGRVNEMAAAVSEALDDIWWSMIGLARHNGDRTEILYSIRSDPGDSADAWRYCGSLTARLPRKVRAVDPYAF